jgi:hypothetical protein
LKEIIVSSFSIQLVDEETYLRKSYQSDEGILECWSHENSKHLSVRNHVGIQNPNPWVGSKVVALQHLECVIHVTCLESMVLVGIGRPSEVHEVGEDMTERSQGNLESWVSAIVRNDDAELVSWIVQVEGGLDSIENNVNGFLASCDNKIDAWNVVPFDDVCGLVFEHLTSGTKHTISVDNTVEHCWHWS